MTYVVIVGHRDAQKLYWMLLQHSQGASDGHLLLLTAEANQSWSVGSASISSDRKNTWGHNVQ